MFGEALSAAAGRSSPVPVLIGSIILGCVFMPAVIWMNSAQVAFVKLYRQIHHVDLPLPNERLDQLFENPPRFTLESMNTNVTVLNLLITVQPEPEIERARRRVLWRIALCMAIGVVGVGAVFFLTVV